MDALHAHEYSVLALHARDISNKLIQQREDDRALAQLIAGERGFADGKRFGLSGERVRELTTLWKTAKRAYACLLAVWASEDADVGFLQQVQYRGYDFIGYYAGLYVAGYAEGLALSRPYKAEYSALLSMEVPRVEFVHQGVPVWLFRIRGNSHIRFHMRHWNVGLGRGLGSPTSDTGLISMIDTTLRRDRSIRSVRYRSPF